MDNKKYFVIPGYVIEKRTGYKTFYDGYSIMRAYNVQPEECIVWSNFHKEPEVPKGLIVLYPRFDGIYHEYPEIRCNECWHGTGYIKNSCREEYTSSIKRCGYDKCPKFRHTFKSIIKDIYRFLFGWL